MRMVQLFLIMGMVAFGAGCEDPETEPIDPATPDMPADTDYGADEDTNDLDLNGGTDTEPGTQPGLPGGGDTGTQPGQPEGDAGSQLQEEADEAAQQLEEEADQN